MEKVFTPNIEGEMDEIKRVSQQLTRNESYTVSTQQVIDALSNSVEQPLRADIWIRLENTESNEIGKGEFDKVLYVAKMYDKSNPYRLMDKLSDGDYERPMIVKFNGDRYHLVSGNTRLCTAASMGMTPMVFIGDLDEYTKEKETINESLDDRVVTNIHNYWKNFGGPSIKNLKYVGIKDEDSVDAEVFAKYYQTDMDGLLGKLDEELLKYRFETQNYVCGGYDLNFSYVDISWDDVDEDNYNADIFLIVDIDGDSEFTLFDGVSAKVKEVLLDPDKFDDDYGYDSTGYIVAQEIEECVQEYFNDLIVREKYGLQVYSVRFNVLTF